MILYVGFDDTDTIDCGRGTGKLARWFVDILPDGCSSLGVVRQQLLHRSDIPMTSHNSSLTVILEVPGKSYTSEIIKLAADHVSKNFFDGSDPGICVVEGDSERLDVLAEFGRRCTYQKVTMQDAIAAAKGVYLEGHGGTDMGIIGAAAGVGLTYKGNSGRYVEYRDTRFLPDETTVKELSDRGIYVMSVNRHAEIPAPGDKVFNHGSLRPILMFGRPVSPVIYNGSKGRWQTINEKASYPADPS
jgi:tRNA(Ile2) C34 agmatinyltransferase TiaS